MKKILFVCTGNTCRSSMAEGIARSIVEERGLKGGIEFSSAGTAAFPGDRAAFQAVEAAALHGADLKNHSARRLSREHIEQADIILTMTGRHKSYLIEIFPEMKDKIFTLKGYADGKDSDIDDPFGCSVEIYKECARELKVYIEKVIDKIIKS